MSKNHAQRQLTRRFPIFLLSITIAANSFAPPQENSILNKITTIRGISIQSDTPGESTFEFVGPNEQFGHLFESCFGVKDGSLISVGTFRGLNNASSGKVAHLVLMDFNYGIYLFNLINLQLVQVSSDRFEYLSLLLTGERNLSLIEKARSGQLSLFQFADELTTVLQADLPDEGIVIQANRQGLSGGVLESSYQPRMIGISFQANMILTLWT